MLITLDLPDAKFKAGDFVLYTFEEPEGVGVVKMRITAVVMEGGQWGVRDGIAYTSEWHLRAFYYCVVQPSSWPPDRKRGPLRPGMHLVLKIAEVDATGRPYKHRGKIWEGDSQENWQEREAHRKKYA